MDELYAGGNAATAEIVLRLVCSLRKCSVRLSAARFDVDRPAGRMRYDEPDVSTGTFSEQDTTTSDLNLEPCGSLEHVILKTVFGGDDRQSRRRNGPRP